MTETFRIQMMQESAQLGITLSDSQLEQFYSYYEMLVEKNKVMNLTAITEECEVVTKHFSDSLSLFGLLREMQAGGDAWYKTCNVIDVGTGAGFPGIPLKIVFPELRVTLLDSLNKRVIWLKEVCTDLGLEGVSRAVANLSSLSEYCMPFVKVGGYFIPYKSGEIDEELNQAKKAIGILGGKLKSVEKFVLPGTDAARSLVMIEKVKPVSKKYPRKAGLPTKEPLK